MNSSMRLDARFFLSHSLITAIAGLLFSAGVAQATIQMNPSPATFSAKASVQGQFLFDGARSTLPIGAVVMDGALTRGAAIYVFHVSNAGRVRIDAIGIDSADLPNPIAVGRMSSLRSDIVGAQLAVSGYQAVVVIDRLNSGDMSSDFFVAYPRVLSSTYPVRLELTATDQLSGGAVASADVLLYDQRTPSAAWNANMEELRWDAVYDGADFEGADAVAVDLGSSTQDVIASGIIRTAEGDGFFTVIKLAGDSGDELWQYSLTASGNGFDRATVVRVTAAGDVVAGGTLDGSPSIDHRSMTVVKLAGDDKTVLWKKEIEGITAIATGRASLTDLVLDSDEDVIACGSLANGNGETYFAVVKFNGTTGVEAWRFLRDADTGAQFDGVTSCEVDSRDNVLAGGVLRSNVTDSDMVVFKISGATGVEQWKYIYEGGAPRLDYLYDIAVTSSDDIYAAGAWSDAQGGRAAVVMKISGTNGSKQWTKLVYGPGGDGFNSALVVREAPSGDAIVGSSIERDGGSDYHFTVHRFRHTDGAEVWSTRVEGSGGGSIGQGYVNDLLVDVSGDVIAVGKVRNTPFHDDLMIAKLRGSDGFELDRREFNGDDNSLDTANAVALDADSSIVVAGIIDSADTGRDFVVLKLPEPRVALGQFAVLLTLCAIQRRRAARHKTKLAP